MLMLLTAALAGMVKVCVWEPPLDHLLKFQMWPWASVCCDGADTVWVSPTPQVKLSEGQLLRPSTVRLRPGGLVKKPTWAAGTYMAVSVTGLTTDGTV